MIVCVCVRTCVFVHVCICMCVRACVCVCEWPQGSVSFCFCPCCAEFKKNGNNNNASPVPVSMPWPYPQPGHFFCAVAHLPTGVEPGRTVLPLRGTWETLDAYLSTLPSVVPALENGVGGNLASTQYQQHRDHSDLERQASSLPLWRKL